jgi:hypothetical protein
VALESVLFPTIRQQLSHITSGVDIQISGFYRRGFDKRWEFVSSNGNIGISSSELPILNYFTNKTYISSDTIVTSEEQFNQSFTHKELLNYILVSRGVLYVAKNPDAIYTHTYSVITNRLSWGWMSYLLSDSIDTDSEEFVDSQKTFPDVGATVAEVSDLIRYDMSSLKLPLMHKRDAELMIIYYKILNLMGIDYSTRTGWRNAIPEAVFYYVGRGGVNPPLPSDPDERSLAIYNLASSSPNVVWWEFDLDGRYDNTIRVTGFLYYYIPNASGDAYSAVNVYVNSSNNGQPYGNGTQWGLEDDIGEQFIQHADYGETLILDLGYNKISYAELVSLGTIGIQVTVGARISVSFKFGRVTRTDDDTPNYVFHNP